MPFKVTLDKSAAKCMKCNVMSMQITIQNNYNNENYKKQEQQMHYGN